MPRGAGSAKAYWHTTLPSQANSVPICNILASPAAPVLQVMPYSTACSTPLSNFEAGQNYKDVSDPAVVVSFPLDGDEGECGWV